VCDGCYIKIKLAKVAEREAVPHLLGTSSPLANKLPKNMQNRSTNSNVTEEQFDDDLKKAIELSLKESQQQMSFEEFIAAPSNIDTRKKTQEEEEEEAQIAAAIAASLADLKISSAKNPHYTSAILSNETTKIDMENVELFSNLMERIRATGNNVANDPEIHRLYTQIGTLQPKLVRELDEVSKKHGKKKTLLKMIWR
jgi:growth factor-regulated tyrosine kinase substrate